VKVGEDSFHYQVAGEGEPVVLVHGLSASSLWWTRNVPTLSEHHRVYLLDLPGFGSMRRYATRFALSRLPAEIVAWMRAIGMQRAHFVGHSMGGYVSLRIAAQNPEVVRRLVLVAPAAIPLSQNVLGYTAPLFTAVRYVPPAFLPILAYDALRAGPLMLLRAARELLAADSRTSLSAITSPTLLVWGEHDALVPPTLAASLRQEIRGARLLILQGAGHVAMFDRPTQFNTALLAFLAGESVGT
jgi:pimeloyl-ACP methyl ester carboxylesterase